MIGNTHIFELSKNSSGSDTEDLFLKYEGRKNRRKNLTPQKAIQINMTQCDPCTSSVPVDILPSIQKDLDEEGSFIDFNDSNDDSSLSESEFIPNIYDTETLLNEFKDNPANQDFLNQLNEEDIFKDIHVTQDKPVPNFKESYQSYRAIKCNMCEQVFVHRTDFDKHYVHSYNLSPVYTCTFCNKTAEKYSTFRSHCYRHMTEGRYKCSTCSKGFNVKSLLHIHVLSKHTKAKPFTCDQCGKKFVTKPGLTIHQRKHKTETKEDYPCVICGKILHTRGGLTSHMNVHRLGRRFMCDVCGKTFTQKVNMQQHVKQHTGDKPHACDKCGKTFAERSHLSRHYSFHSDQRPYKCDVCKKMYKTERCLKVHSRVHASTRPYVCNLCNKDFLSSTKLKQHANTHTGERPYKCKHCERTFTNYPNLLKHTRRKHKSDVNTDISTERINADEKDESHPICIPGNPLIDLLPDEQFSDVPLLKTDDIMIEPNLINITLTEEKYLLPQSFEILPGPNNGVDVIVPYLQNTLPSHQSLIQHINQSALSNQYNNLSHPQNQCIQ